MENGINSFYRLLAVVDIADIALKQSEIRIVRKRQKIFSFSGGKVIQNRYPESCSEQMLNQIGADESGTAGNQNMFHKTGLLRAAAEFRIGFQQFIKVGDGFCQTFA